MIGKTVRLACLALVGITFAMAAAADGDDYRMKVGDAPVGSLLRNSTITGDLPYDKRYQDLTPAEKAHLKAYYEPMGADDEPPFPDAGLGVLLKAVRTTANAFGASGQLYMAVEVGPEGTARSVSVFKSIDDETTRYVAMLLMATKFKPAICKGQPCTMSFPLNVNFVTEP